MPCAPDAVSSAWLITKAVSERFVWSARARPVAPSRSPSLAAAHCATFFTFALWPLLVKNRLRSIDVRISHSHFYQN